MPSRQTRRTTVWLCTVAVLMALNVIMSSFSIPVPGGHLYLCDIVICTAALLLDPLGAFLVGGIGSFIGDMLFYPVAMFVTLATHGLQAIVISVFAHYVWKKHPAFASVTGLTLGGILMVVGYSLGRAFVYASPEYAVIKLPYEILQAALGAVAGALLVRKGHLDTLYRRVSRRY